MKSESNFKPESSASHGAEPTKGADAPIPRSMAEAVLKQFEQWKIRGSMPSNGNDEPWLREGSALLIVIAEQLQILLAARASPIKADRK